MDNLENIQTALFDGEIEQQEQQTASDTEQTGQTEQTTAGNTPAEPPTTAADEVEITVNGEKRTVNLRDKDTIALLQKGADYDRVKTKLEDARKTAEDSKQALELIDRLAEQNGMSRKEYLDEAERNRSKSIIAAELQELRDAHPYADDELLEELARARAQKKAPSVDELTDRQAQADKAKQDAVWDRFLEAFPDQNDIEKLPEAVKQAVLDGSDPVAAMYRHQRDEYKQALEDEKKARTADAQNEKNRRVKIGRAHV